MKHASYFFATALATIVAVALWTSSALAVEGIASQGTSLGGLSDKQCVRKVDKVIANERRNSDNYLRVVKAEFTRRVFYGDGSVDFACFPNQVIITVYFNNAGERTAERDLRNFLKNF